MHIYNVHVVPGITYQKLPLNTFTAITGSRNREGQRSKRWNCLARIGIIAAMNSPLKFHEIRPRAMYSNFSGETCPQTPLGLVGLCPCGVTKSFTYTTVHALGLLKLIVTIIGYYL